tara:strand:- start:4847 stop:5581 length:735 start_codon:yes stop_codon:yes gene_type:complete
MNSNLNKIKSEGYTVFENIISKSYLGEIFNLINKKYIINKGFKKGLLVGDKRYMLNIELDQEIIDHRIYANENIIEVIYKLLGKNVIIESFGVVFSLPGASHQGFHRDGNILFDDYSVEGNLSISGFIPPYALTLAIPLIKIDKKNGSTEIKSNTHRYQENNKIKLLKPNLNLGSALLWDFRTLHGGGPNKSNQVRPLIYLTYSREWWRDTDNYKKLNQKRVNITPDFFNKIDQKYKSLFRYCI